MNIGLLEQQVLATLRADATLTATIPAASMFETSLPDDKIPLPYLVVHYEAQATGVEVVMKTGWLEVDVTIRSNLATDINTICNRIYSLIHDLSLVSSTNFAKLQFRSTSVPPPTDARQGVKRRIIVFKVSESYKE